MHPAVALAGIALSAVLLAGCENKAKPRSAAAGAPAALAVARGVVDQDSGLVRIGAPHDGVIQRVLVQEGDTVKPGQVLAEMDARQSRLAMAAAEAEAADRTAQVGMAQAKLAVADRDDGRLGRLAAQDAAPRQDADQAHAAAQIARAEYAQTVQAARAADARRDLQRFAVQSGDLKAVGAGRIVRRTATQGASVLAGAPLFVIEPAAPRVVRAEVDESFADKVSPGMRVAVSREFDTAGSLPGHVLRVSDVYGAAALNDDPSAHADARVISVVVALDKPNGLKLGQRVLVRFGP